MNVTFKPAARKDAKDTLDLDVSAQDQSPTRRLRPGHPAVRRPQPRQRPTHRLHQRHPPRRASSIHTGDNTAIANRQASTTSSPSRSPTRPSLPRRRQQRRQLHLQAKSGVSPPDGSDAIVKAERRPHHDRQRLHRSRAPRLQAGLRQRHARPAGQRSSRHPRHKDDIPLNGNLTFVVQTKDDFPRDQTIEVATANDAVHTKLSPRRQQPRPPGRPHRHRHPRPPQGLRSIRLRQPRHAPRRRRRHPRRLDSA